MSIQNIPDPCEGQLHPRAVAGLEFFNHGEYFEAHEALEDAWRAEPGPARDLYRGILQVAVAYYHLLRGNYSGAVKLFQRCKPWLEPFGDTCRGVNLAKLRQDFLRVESEVLRLGPERLSMFNRNLLKPVEFNLSANRTHPE